MPEEPLSPEDIEKLLATIAPPGIPDETEISGNKSLAKLGGWNKAFTVSVLAGLLTDPHFYANGIRLDWLQRLVFSKSEGRRKPPATELSKALNAGLGQARVLRLEDPSEDIFCQLITTGQGNFRIFTGQWENAGPYTQTLLDAFHALPEGLVSPRVLESVYALLRISDELAERAGVNPFTETGGSPQGDLPVPSDETLKRLERRVRFSDSDLARLGIEKQMLRSFIIDAVHFPYVSDRSPGDTPLEFHPLLENSAGIVVASPAGISLAIRALLIKAVKAHRAGKALLYLLLKVQQRYSDRSGFWRPAALDLSEPDKHLLRVARSQPAAGHYLQVIQVPQTFDMFPEAAFGTFTTPDPKVGQAIANYVHEFWDSLASEADYRRSMTIVLLSGWGAPRGVAPPIDESREPRNWQFLAMSFADGAVLGATGEGRLNDIARMLKQEEFLNQDGFEFENINGVLNLFGFWLMTNGNLIPEHHSDITPPCHLTIPTDALLEPRIEAHRKTDVRALPFPGGEFKTVQRMDWDGDALKPIYASFDDLMRGQLVGAVSFEEHVWWVKSVPAPDEDREWVYRVWNSVLEWLAAVGKDVVSAFPDAFPPGLHCIQIATPPSLAFEQISADPDISVPLAETILLQPADESQTSYVTISAEWLKYLRRPENDAEIELIAGILKTFAAPMHSILRTNLVEQILASIGSRDWRWMHAQRAVTPMDRMASAGLVRSFRKIPFSAVSLSKCLSVWGFRSRSAGLEIEGENECRDFLTEYRDSLLDALIGEIRTFDRQALVTMAAEAYQAARAEQQHWRRTIRAMRAIHGATADTDAFKHQNEINAVQRAAKSICEIVACEATETGGKLPNRIELEDLFAKVLLIVGNGQLFSAIRAGLLEPKLRISPAGDLLTDRSIFTTTLKPVVEWANSRALDEAAKAYGRDVDEETSGDDTWPWEEESRQVLEAEYGDTAHAFFDLQYAIIQIAEASGQGTFVVRRSKLCEQLDQNPNFPAGTHAKMLERLTLARRSNWRERTAGLTESDIDLSRFDRRYSLINRPLLALDDAADPLLLVAPVLVADATMYSFSGLLDGTLNNEFWVSQAAKSYAGTRGKATGEEFEESVAAKLRDRKMEAWARRKLSWALNQKVDPKLGDVDVLAISPDRKTVWVIEAKNLRLCRSESEVASRLSEYRGRMIRNRKGQEEPDKMLRHVHRVQFLRKHREALCARLKLDEAPIVKGLLIVDSPQPMNFHMLDNLEDGDSAFLEAIDAFKF